MSKAMLSGVIVAAGFVVAAGVYVAVPSLRSAQDAVGVEVREASARARRLLAKVGANQERLEVVLDGLRAAGVGELDGEQISELVESDRDLLVDAEEQLQELARSVQRRRLALQAQYPLAEQLPLTPLQLRFGGNVPQMSQAIREGLKARTRLLAENDRLLDEALQAIRQALGVQQGDASGRDDPAALRLEGLILYAQGTAAQRRAARVRQRAAEVRGQLSALAASGGRRAAGRTLVEASEIEARLGSVRQQEAKQAAAVAEAQSIVQALRGTVARLEAELAEQQAAADAARSKLDALSKESADITGVDEFQAFAAQYSRDSQAYREALRRIQVLEVGTLENAAIDRSGDFIKGRYVSADGVSPVQPGWGLLHYRHGLAVAEGEEADLVGGLTTLRREIEAMESQKVALTVQDREAAKQGDALRAQAGASHEALIARVDEAWSLEDTAIQKLKAAARAFRDAKQATQRRQGDASEALAGLPSEAAQRMAESKLAEDTWTPASDQAREADAHLRLAMVYYLRYRDLLWDADALTALGDALPEDADPEASAAEAEDARMAGLDAAEQAVDALFAASRNMQQHFAITAEIAAAYYLQSLLGEPGMEAAAKQNYAAAIKGREDSPFVTQYRERLAQLRRLAVSSKSPKTPPTDDSAG